MNVFAWLGNLLFPEKCVLCSCVLQDEELDLCRNCRVQVPEHPVCRIKLPFIHSWTALWLYQDNVRRSILRFKFYGRRNYADAYARLLGMKLLREGEPTADLITWVPISEKRRKKRGYDQCRLLADSLSRQLQIPAVPALCKIRNNPPQSGIVGHAQRRANVLGAYIALSPENLTGKKILLVDDILTTGATAGECARVLLTAGAGQVQLAVVAAANQQKNT